MKIIKNEKLYDFVKLGDISKISTGATPSTKEKDFWQDGDINWMSSGEVNKGIIKFIDKKITKKGLSSISGKFFERGTIMMALAGQGKTKGMVGLTEVPTSCNQSLAAIQLIQDRVPYIYYKQLQLIYKKIRALVGEGREGLNIKIVKDINVRDIPLNEQYKIYDVLYSQEKLIENITKLIKKIETRNQYYAEKILSGELRVRKNENGNIEFYNNTEWNEIKINTFIDKQELKIPLDWKKGIFSEHSTFTVGTPIHSSLFNYNNRGLQYLRTGDVWEDASSSKELAFYNGEIEQKFIKKENDYLVSLKGYNKNIGEGTLGLVTNYNNKKGIVCDNMYLVTPKEYDLVAYTAYVIRLNYIQNIILKTAVGSTARFATKMINKIEWIFPSKTEEMLLINDFFVSIDKEISALKALLEKEQLRFQWLLDNLLSGEYQVVDE